MSEIEVPERLLVFYTISGEEMELVPTLFMSGGVLIGVSPTIAEVGLLFPAILVAVTGAFNLWNGISILRRIRKEHRP